MQTVITIITEILIDLAFRIVSAIRSQGLSATLVVMFMCSFALSDLNCPVLVYSFLGAPIFSPRII